MQMWMSRKEKKKKKLTLVQMCCVQMWMSRKKKEKTYFNADGWIADVLHVDALVCGRRWQ